MGPVATQMLADYGADVIKIERPAAGDLSRTSFPDDPAGLHGPVFCSLNRNKRSRRARPAQAGGQGRWSLQLIADADVVVNNFRAGVMERMGFGYEELKELNPRLIYAVGTGFGLTGPYAHKGGQDVLAQAMTRRDGAPLRRRACRSRSTPPPSPTTPPACTWCRACCWRCCSASKTGRGQRSASPCSTRCWRRRRRRRPRIMMRGARGELGRDAAVRRVRDTRRRPRAWSARSRPIRCRTSARRSDLPALHDDPRSRPTRSRSQNKPALQAIFRERFASNTDGILDRPARRAGPALRARAHARRGAGRRADRDQRHDPRDGMTAVETVRVVGSPFISRRRR